MMKSRKQRDFALNGLTITASAIGILVLLVLIIFIFRNGFRLLSWEFITSDFNQTVFVSRLDENSEPTLNNFTDPRLTNPENFSRVWGIALIDSTNTLGESVVEVVYVAENSPFRNMLGETENFELEVGFYITKITMSSPENNFIFALSRFGAMEMIRQLNQATMIDDMVTYVGGGGIRGSLITTIYLIFLTLILALPLGIGAAIYLNEYAKNDKKTALIRSMIDMTAGIPSIIFGLVGALIFIPFMNVMVRSNGGSIAAGALTLTIILLPIIIRTTEEALKVIPDKYRSASLALGASKTQTIFKVVLPNALGGIMTATILSVGRIIGESAALIFVIGTVISDNVSINERSTSLSVHIWTLMAGENPNFEAAAAISILILVMVLLLSITVKIISYKTNKMKEVS
ncbi:MAG: phosphate ABC transporter permease PstA [Erysipelotrichales bacterium]|nr:phosphate ABC transporter permease PstA [Erysipelotrichales bacterium]